MKRRKCNPIGVFDSGLGGISVLYTIRQLLPHEDLLYLGDSYYNPYGTKTKEEITSRCITICDDLVKRGCKAIVIACNTATSACVPLLRERYNLDIIGMEPALKVACEKGKDQKIAVWATDFTLKEEKFARLMERFEDEHRIDKVPCPILVELVEHDQLENEDKVNAVLKEYIDVDKAMTMDSIVLGCTHFVFYKKALKQLLPPTVSLVDGNLGTALHLQELLREKDLLQDKGTGTITIENTIPEKTELSRKLLRTMEAISK